MKMTQMLINIKGLNLGDRHRHLNAMVAKTYNAKEPFETIIALAESSPVDRLFKIDLASKHKHVQYTLKNLQDDDMLYVSRALKCKWLLNNAYRHIINPTYLEDTLYPQMITTAVNKMKHWIHLNLQDSERCKEFYDYYFERDGDYAFKFLCKCTEEIILREFPKSEILSQMTPHKLKVLCEKSHSVAKIFFEILTIDKLLFKKYIAKDYEYFDSVKCILKAETDMFLDLTELHFMSYFKRLSPVSTKFIMSHRKNRFMQKPELYSARILNVATIAQFLNEEECEELVLKLARAKYLSDERWFNYKNVEPLIKRLYVEKRTLLKRTVFINKNIGQLVDDWPYALPVNLYDLYRTEENYDVFLDIQESPENYDHYGDTRLTERFLKACGTKPAICCTVSKPKTLLDSLFDEYRFMSFENTLFELCKKIKLESSLQNRMYMMLVLVSKSGGREESLHALFQLLMEHRNESCQIRAAVIRSLVKRVCIWRVAEDIWKKLLVFGQGLGLDGGISDAECNEGLHAVVIRTLLSNHGWDPEIKTAFINNFSPLTNYSLTVTEKQQISKELLNMLNQSANDEVSGEGAAQILQHSIDTLQAYNIKFNTCPDVIDSIRKLVIKDQTAARDILKRLFDSKLGRKELFKENFNLIQTDASYNNALKHDITVLSVDTYVNSVISNNMKSEQFLRKTNIYFNGTGDLNDQFLNAIKQASIHKRLARPLAYLIGPKLKSYLLELDSMDEEAKRFSSLVRANAHVTRPVFNIGSLGLQKSGAKLVANKVLKCRAEDIDRLIEQLLTWNRTAKLAITLAQRTSYEAKVFEAVAKIRPTVALKSALKYFRRHGEQSNLQVWNIVKPVMVNAKDSMKANRHLLYNVKKVESIPLKIRPEYATDAFKVISNINFNESLSILCHIMFLLPNIEESFIESVLYDFIHNKFILGKIYNDYNGDKVVTLHLKIFAKYLLLCKTEDNQNRKWEKIGRLYLDCLQSHWASTETKTRFIKYLNAIIHSFKYTDIFLNDEYVSCLPVIEKFVEWMHGILPMEKFFSFYVPLHLTMLYYKSIRQVTKQIPEMLADERVRCSQGYKIFGETFGKDIGRDARVLTKRYFDSIVEVYGAGLVEYMRCFNSGRYRLIPFIIRGIIEVSEGHEWILAQHLFIKNSKNFDEAEREDIRKCMRDKGLIEIQFFIDTNSSRVQ